MRLKLFTITLVGAMTAGIIGAATAADVKSLRDKDIDSTNSAPPVYSTLEDQRFGRAFRQQPPMIPHAVDKYQIDLKANECLKCHDWPYAAKENAPKVSETHYRDRDGNQLDGVSRSRWFCTQCHAPQFDAKPLVENTFKSAVE